MTNKTNNPSTITTLSHTFNASDIVIITGIKTPWWRQLWRWFFRKPVNDFEGRYIIKQRQDQ